MQNLSADLTDFQDSLIDLLGVEIDLSEGPAQHYYGDKVTDSAIRRGRYLNSGPEAIIDHGSMMAYDPSKDWTRTTPAMADWEPSKRDVRMATVVSSAEAVERNGINGFFASMRNQIELKLGLREAAELQPSITRSKGLTR